MYRCSAEGEQNDLGIEVLVFIIGAVCSNMNESGLCEMTAGNALFTASL